MNPDSIEQTTISVGLTASEVKSRLERFGSNELPIHRPRLLLVFLKKFWGPSAWMLEFILIISLFLRKYDDFLVVSVLLVVNASISFFLERRATNIIENLKTRLQIQVRVLRDAQWSVISASGLVPGDIIRIRSGDFVSADLMVVEGELEVDQSALTGESIDVHCKPQDRLISGSIVRRGEALAMVERTGSSTQYGKTATLIQNASPKLHIEQVVIKVVTWLFVVVVMMMALVISLALFRGTPLLETLPILLILMMSAIPISLPVMFTVCLSVGARDLAKHGVLVTHLSAVEDAASMEQLCIDKTGTVTLNQLHVVEVYPFGHFNEGDVILTGALASQQANQDPIDLAFIGAEKNLHLGVSDYEVISYHPFDAVSRSTTALVRIQGQDSHVMKGAVNNVMDACNLDEDEKARINLKVNQFGKMGYRVLAVARGPAHGTLIFMGLVALFDPPRPEAQQFIEEIKKLGVSLKMLTGDALVVARELSSRVGLGDILPLIEFKKLAQTAGNADPGTVMNCGGFAEVYPEDKYLVVKYLQSMGYITGMTGDGVNDAPALRQAEVGIAVSGSTDIARSAASIVLTEPGLSNIVYLITQGRAVYQRLLTWVMNKISRTILKAPYVAITYLLTGKFVISAFAMLILVLVTDSTKIALATDRVRSSQAPESWKINGYVFIAIILGLVMLLESLLLLWFGWNTLHLNSNDEGLNTFSFLCLLYFGAFSILSVRERLHFWSTWPGSILLVSFGFEVIAGTVLATFGLRGMGPLPAWQILGVFLYAMLACLFVNDWIKYWMMKRLRLGQTGSLS